MLHSILELFVYVISQSTHESYLWVNTLYVWISIKNSVHFQKLWCNQYIFFSLGTELLQCTTEMFSRQPHPRVQFVYFVFPVMIWCDHSFLPPLTQVCVLAKVPCPLCVPALGFGHVHHGISNTMASLICFYSRFSEGMQANLHKSRSKCRTLWSLLPAAHQNGIGL